MLPSVGIKTKMTVAILLSAMASLLIAIVGGIGMGQVDAQNRYLYQKQVLPMSYLQEVHASELKSRLDLHRIALARTAKDRQARYEGLKTTDAELATATAGYKRTSEMADSPAMRQYETNWNKYIQVRDAQLLPMAMSGDLAGFSRVMADVGAPLISTAADGIDQLVAMHAKQAEASAKSATDHQRSGMVLIAIVALLGTGLSIAFSQFVAGRMIRGLQKVRTVLKAVAEGDLTQDASVDSKDELGEMGDALDKTVATLHDVIVQIGDSAASLSSVTQHASAHAEPGDGTPRSETFDARETEAQLAEMADTLNAMISVFVTRPQKREEALV